MKRVLRPVLLVALAVLWMGLQGTFTFGEFVWGLLMALIVLALFPLPVEPHDRPVFRGVGDLGRWLWALVKLLGYFSYELVKADIQVALMALRPRIKERLTPGIIGMRLTGKSSGQISLLAALITLTPGTISIECSADREWLYIHCIDASDEEGALAAPRQFEQMIMEVLR
ncbi:MAG TPA: Na+/H+ antiporter subunit E [Symbiobacteriaceae bacterium]|nr:Na+/H+ antiporter subunit E [Symbiobacteriaceae bacterium]